jgi:hypothetical protein
MYLPTMAISTLRLALLTSATIASQSERSVSRSAGSERVARDDAVEAGVDQHDRHLVDRELDVALLDGPARGARCRTARSFLAISSDMGFSVRQMSTSGWMPISRSLPHRLLRGLGLELARGLEVGEQRQVHEQQSPRGRLQRELRIASRNGRLSMSPTVPPISVMATSASSGLTPAGVMASLIASVMCGMTCTVRPR